MKESTRNHASCAICHSRPADKKNSHLIPSFFIAMISSVDNSYKRDKELLYTINETITTAYIGRGVREEELLRSFDSVSDERLDMMKQNTDSKDYIFCPHCERKLGEYLESPWHDHLFNKRRIDPSNAYFFWVSILWRISAFEVFNFKLPTHLEEALRKRLNAFIQAKDQEGDTSELMNKLPFSYKVLYCKDFSKHHEGMIYCEYDRKTKIVSLILGDVAACFTFNKRKTFDGFSFYGLESKFSEAPVNDGSSQETILNIDTDVLNAFNSTFIPKIQFIRLKKEREKILALWDMAIDKLAMPLPPKPDERFIQYVIRQLYDETVKSGEKTTPEYFAKCFKLGLARFYNIHLQ